MLPRRLWVVMLAALCLWGCGKGSTSKRVDELVIRQGEHDQKISQTSRKIDAVDEKLTRIEKSVNALLARGSGAASTERAQVAVSSNFASTKEYQDITRQIGVVQEQLATVQQEFADLRARETQGGAQDALRDRGSAWRAMGEPKELSQRLDNLARNFSGRIADPATRTQFVNELENMKGRYGAQLSPEQKREQARALVSEAISSTQDERARGWMEGQLRSLDEAGSPEELTERADRVIQFQRMREIGELTRKYNIPQEVVRDSGLVSFDRGGPGGGPGGFGPRGGR